MSDEEKIKNPNQKRAEASLDTLEVKSCCHFKLSG